MLMFLHHIPLHLLDPKVDRTVCFVASITIPVLSNTPLGNSCASYSMYSSFAGVPDAATAILTAVVLVPLLTMLTDTTLKVSAGTVYTEVSAG